MQNHFSINGASEILERQRRTIKKALRHTPADSFERGQPRWRLPTIIAALQGSGNPLIPPHQVSGDGADGKLEEACRAGFAKFDAAVAALEKLPTLAQRRARAVELGPMAAASIATMRVRDEAAGLHEQHIDLKCQEVLRLSLWALLGPTQWTKDEVWEHIISRNGDLTEEDSDDDR
jgi:hypothetical protein